MKKVLIFNTHNTDITYFIFVLVNYDARNLAIDIYNKNNCSREIENIYNCVLIKEENENCYKLFENYDIILVSNIENIDVNKLNKEKIYYIYKNESLVDIGIHKNVSFINNLPSLEYYLSDVEMLNIDDNNEYKLINQDSEYILLKNREKKINCESHYFYINNKIIEKLKFSKIVESSFSCIEVKEIKNDGYYPDEGIVKIDNKFYYKVENNICKVDMERLKSRFNYKIKTIYYEKINNSDNFIICEKLELHFTIIILSNNNNNNKYAKINLESALSQDYSNFDVIYIDCDLTEKTLFENTKEHDNFYYFINKEKCCEIENFLLGSSISKNNSIIVFVDSCDLLYDDQVLNNLNNIYLLSRCLSSINMLQTHVHEETKYTSQLVTCKKRLLDSVEYKKLKINGDYSEIATNILISLFFKDVLKDRFCVTLLKFHNCDMTNINSNTYNNSELQLETAKYFYDNVKFDFVYCDNEISIINNNYLKNNFVKRHVLLLCKLVELYFKDKISIYKSFTNLLYNYEFLNIIDTDEFILKNPVLTNSIENNYDCYSNILKYKDVINENLKLLNKNNEENLFVKDDFNSDELMFEYLKDMCNKLTINFSNLNYYSSIVKKEGLISIIVPVKDRDENLVCLLDNLIDVMSKKGNNNYIINIIEYNNTKYKQLCHDKQVNYISLMCECYIFNKCLCFNFCYKLLEKENVNYKYLLLHDVDCLVGYNFFEEIFKCDYDNNFIQPYKDSRVLICDENISKKIREEYKNKNINECINENTQGIKEAIKGSSGGTIFLKKEMFECVGGLDYYYFSEYGMEDLMFFSKLILHYKKEHCNNIESNIYHLYHKSKVFTENKQKDMFCDMFLLLSEKKKKELVKIMSEYFCEIKI